MNSRRQILAASAAWALLVRMPSHLLAGAALAKPPFRLLYSNDTTNITSCVSPYHNRGEPFRPEMLQASIDEVAGMGVDAHMLQPGLGMVPMWPSQVLPLEAHYAWIKQRYGQRPDSFGQFVLDGGDVVRVFVERCRQRGQSPLISFRLNDAHHKEYVDPRPGDRPGTSIGMSVTRFYAEHPEYRIAAGSQRGADLVQNWAEPAVRAQKFALLCELCENYDIDGLELDFLRFYSFFRLGQTTAPQRRDTMTAFVQQVRELLDRTQRHGRRRWLGVRVPCYREAFDPLGLDLKALVEVGVDMVNASSHYFTTQRHQLADIRRQVPTTALYFELCHTIWKGAKLQAGYDVFPYRRATHEHLCTAAHLAYARGADGISLFNFPYYRQHGQGDGRGEFGEPPFDVLPLLANPRQLAQQPQHWFAAPDWRAPGAKPLPLPRSVDAGRPAAFMLDLAAPRDGWRGEARLRIQFNGRPEGHPWKATFNGQPIAPTADVSEPFPVAYPSMIGRPEELLAWRVDAALLREGANRVEIAPSAGPTATILFLDLSLAR